MAQRGSHVSGLASDRIAQLIHREGPITFDVFMEAALYGQGGFFASGGGSGRAGSDFITSPHVGSLFGVCVARALDRYWSELGRPDPLLVVDAGVATASSPRRVARPARVLGGAALRPRRALERIARQATRAPAARTGRRGARTVRAADRRRRGGPGPGRGACVRVTRRAACDRSERRRGVRERTARQPSVRRRGVGRCAVARGAGRLRAGPIHRSVGPGLQPGSGRRPRVRCAGSHPAWAAGVVPRARPRHTPRHRRARRLHGAGGRDRERGRGCARTANIVRVPIRSSRRDRATSRGTSPSSSCWPRRGASRWSRTRRRTPGSATSASTSSPTPAHNVGARARRAAISRRSRAGAWSTKPRP